MKSDKYLFIDIGSSETKIVEASVKHSKITVLKTAIMPDMSLYLSNDNIIKVIEGFCLSLKKTLKDCDIKSRRAFICSSILGLTTKDLSSDFQGYKDCSTRFSRVYNRVTDPTHASDWQFMGESIANSTITQHLLATFGPINIVENFILALHKIGGITIVGLESSFTAQANLQMLYSATFDLPSIAVVNLGEQQVTCQYFKSGAYVYSSVLKPAILNLAGSLAARFAVPLPKILYLLHTVGLEPNLCDSELPAEGIDPNAFIQYGHQLIDELLADIQKSILNAASLHRLENVRVVFTGGLLEMPGFVEYLRKNYSFTPFEVMSIPSSYDTREFTIVNKLNKTLGPKFSNCIGLSLKVFNNIHTTNIVPKELVVLDFGKAANFITAGILGFFSLALLVVLLLGISPLSNCIQKQAVPEQLHQLETTTKLLQIQATEYENYINNISSINKSLTPFLRRLAIYENQNIRVASVDSADILKASITSSEETLEPQNTIKENPLADLILRGYAKTSDDITAFYNRLHMDDSVGSLNITGIREVKLTKQDRIYIFEIRLEVKANA